MSSQSFEEVLAVQRVVGPTKNTFTAPVTCLDPTALATIGPNVLRPGSLLRARVTGSLSNIVTTPGLMNFQLVIGGVAVFDTGNMQLNAIAHTTVPFWLDILWTCRAIGNGTNANGIGLAAMVSKPLTFTAAQVDSVQDMPTLVAPATTPAVGTGFNSTIANVVDLFAGFTISNVGNQVIVQQYVLELLN